MIAFGSCCGPFASPPWVAARRNVMSHDPLDYRILLQDALRGVVRRSLEIVEEQGFPGDHHFYLSFRTGSSGVVMPPHLRQQYPEEMTIVLKTQFRDLSVGEDAFSVGLFFGGVLHYLTVPFASLLSFADPAAGFQTAFGPLPEAEAEGTGDAVPEAAQRPSETASTDNVVSFAGFRKKK